MRCTPCSAVGTPCRTSDSRVAYMNLPASPPCMCSTHTARTWALRSCYYYHRSSSSSSTASRRGLECCCRPGPSAVVWPSSSTALLLQMPSSQSPQRWVSAAVVAVTVSGLFVCVLARVGLSVLLCVLLSPVRTSTTKRLEALELLATEYSRLPGYCMGLNF